MTPAAFRRIVWKHYRKEGRHELPWRPPALKLRRDKTLDAYKILVSEVMLQQTQVDRVRPFYTEFVKKFPTAKRLAAAPLAEVLKAWQGLGYNRRAKMLHEAAQEIVAHGMPRDAAGLEKLPGIGPYTARAVAAFAWNEPGVMIETNIRTAVIHHFFPKKKKVSDAEIEKVLKSAAPDVVLAKSREWYWALMDYGASLKRAGVRANVRAKGYAKQATFAGSLRQARGAIVKELSRGARSAPRLLGLLGDDRHDQVGTALAALVAEGLIVRHRRGYALPGRSRS